MNRSLFCSTSVCLIYFQSVTLDAQIFDCYINVLELLYNIYNFLCLL